MAQLFNYSKGVWEDVDEASIPSLVASGSHGLEGNQNLQMVGPDGSQYDVNSNDAAMAFRQGYRFATPEDLSAQYDADLAKQQAARLDNPGKAFAAQALGAASFGAMDVAGKAFGGEDYVQARKGLQEANPKATVAGEVAGILGSAVAVPFGPAALAEKAGAGAAKLATGLTGEGAGFLARTAPKVLSSAAENAVWGAGTGISEAALGRPEDVVNNIVSHAGMAALIGGGFSGLFNGARAVSPLFDSAVEGASTAAGKIVSKANDFLGKRVLKSSLKAKGVNEADDIVETLLSNEGRAVTEMDQAGKLAALEDEAAAVTSTATKAAEKQRSILLKSMDAALDAEGKEAKKAAQLALAESSGSIQDASTRLYDKYLEADNAMITHARENLAEQYAAASGKDYQKVVSRAVKRLEKIGDNDARAKIAELQQMADNYADHIAANPNAADEVIGWRALREKAGRMIRKGADTSEGRDAIRSLYRESSDFLQNYPDKIVAGFEKDTVSNYKAYTSIRDFFANKTNVKSYFFDPASAPEINELLHSFQTVLPEMRAFRMAGRDATKRTEVADRAYNAYEAAKRAAGLNGQEIGPEAFKEAFMHFGDSLKGDIKQAMERYNTLSGALDNPNLTPTDRAILLSKLTGNDSTAIEQLAPLAKTVKALNTVKEASVKKPGREIAQAAADIGTDYVAFSMGGFPAMAAKRAVMGAYRDPMKILNGINAVDRAAQAGAAKMAAAVKKASAGLLSNTSEKVAIRSVTAATNRENRERYNRMVKNLGKLADPQVFMQSVANATRGLEEMPALKQAVAGKLESSLAIIQEALPVDPLAGKSLFPSKNPYQPSDFDVARFNRVVNVVNNPLVAVEKISDGTITKDEVDTLRKAHPDVYNQLQSEMISAMMSAEQDIPYRKKLLIEQVFGIPVDYAMTPEFTAKMQANFVQADEGGRPVGAQDSQPRKAKLNIKPFETIATETDQFQKDS